MFIKPFVLFTVALKVIVTDAQAASVHRLPDNVLVLSVYEIVVGDTLLAIYVTPLGKVSLNLTLYAVNDDVLVITILYEAVEPFDNATAVELSCAS